MNNRDMHIQGPQINQFNNIAPKKIPRSVFKRDFPYRTTFNSDVLIPFFVDEILPGDDVSLSMIAQVRMTTPLKPIMDNLYFETFWFFVPNRLVWTNWQKFQGQQTNPGDSVAYTIPVLDKTKAPLSTTGFVNQSVYDYMGMPTLVQYTTGGMMGQISCLFNRGADLCWNEWFRDENLQNSLAIPLGDGPDDPAIYTLRKRNKRKDYITSGLPWPQKGNPVTVPLGSTAPVVFINGSTDPGLIRTNLAGNAVMPSIPTLGTDVSGQLINSATGPLGIYDPNGTLAANLSAASAITINLLRQSALYQQILELDARGGTRYVESIYSRFGVISPDFRLQRPELIGQGSTRINVFAVPQTGATGATGTTTPQGNLAAFSATPITGGHGCRYSATEHGMLIGFGNVRADLTYQQKLPRMFTRQTRLDFYEPLLNGLGEQVVTNAEVMATGLVADANPFCYQERFAEYRYRDPMITGIFRSNDPLTLQVWHLSQYFGSAPTLDSSFITSTTPMDRVLAVATATAPNFLMDAQISYNHVRPMPIRSNPGINIL